MSAAMNLTEELAPLIILVSVVVPWLVLWLWLHRSEE